VDHLAVANGLELARALRELGLVIDILVVPSISFEAIVTILGVPQISSHESLLARCPACSEQHDISSLSFT
jgi:hypothetical protein